MIRQRIGIGVVGWLASAVVLTIGAPAAGATTELFSYIGGANVEQQFTVPAGVRSVSITAIGGNGGKGPYAAGGRGASITDVFAVTPGQTLYVEVAAAGNSAGFCCTANPGGGGKGGASDVAPGWSGGGGGGASDVRTVSAATAGTLTSRLIVAAGGAGAGGNSRVAGRDAGAARCALCTRSGGYPGTLTAGGAGESGALAGNGRSGSPGSLGVGGDGGNGGAGGGGGGGGVYGGGGGGGGASGGGADAAIWGTGGGGGSSYSRGGAGAAPTSAPASITFTYVVGAATPPGTTPPGTTPPGTRPPGTTRPGTTPPGATPPGTTRPGTTPSGTTPPGTRPPGTTRPGTTPGTGLEPSRASISALRLSRSFFRAARSGSSTGTQMVAGLPRVSYSLNAPARVRFGVQRATIGRRVGGRCMATSRTNRKRSRCTRFVTLSGTFTRNRAAGSDRFTLTGRLAGRTLNPGSYRLLATPITDGRSGMTKRTAFRITRR